MDESYPMQANKSCSPQIMPLIERMHNQRRELEASLAQVSRTIALLEENPKIMEVLNELSKLNVRL